MNNYYQFLDDQINSSLGVNLGFNNLIASGLYTFDSDILKGFFKRYDLIKKFQEITLSLFKASLQGEFDPELAELVINELPDNQGWKYHQRLTERQHHTPAFFRTDEVAPGKISEIQCPGSSWGLYEQIYHFYQNHSSVFGEQITFPKSLATAFADTVKQSVNPEPCIHHLLDNASIPHGMRYFIQSTRKHNLKYYGYDKDVTPYNCNFVRSHDFVSLFYNNFAKQRLADCENQLIRYDLPPTALFEQKVIMSFPFWKKTRDYYSDEIRNLFPYTQIIRPEGFYLEDGCKICINDFIKLSRKERSYYLKYAGCDVSINWGSKGVFFAGSLSQKKINEIFSEIINGHANKKYWIIQKSYLESNTANYLTRNGDENKIKIHSKYSGFYGSNGLIGILIMERPFYKVHGNVDTIMNLCK